MKYLYGARVQGIQQFIFQTNKLKEIAGASQLVDVICEKKFLEFYRSHGHHVQLERLLQAAAGNIRYLATEEEAATIVYHFSKFISEYAPGISITQALVSWKGDLKTEMRELEEKLKAQRNRVPLPIDQGLMGIERMRRTGGLAHHQYKDGQLMDRATLAKVEGYKGDHLDKFGGQKSDRLHLFKKFQPNISSEDHIPFDIAHICSDSDHPWLAIIHADGNSMSQLVRRILGESISKDKRPKAFRTFSRQLDVATRAAAQAAFAQVVEPAWSRIRSKDAQAKYPFRPVVLGGDDVTVIIRADLAFAFTTAFLAAFEKETRTHFAFLQDYEIDGFDKGLTACAGISYLKYSYPFHYAVDLAESLTKEAKQFSKGLISPGELPPSSLSFYKIQASFTSKLSKMREETQFAKASGCRFHFGPYLLHPREGCADVGLLREGLEQLAKYNKEDTKGVSKLRRWVDHQYDQPALATFLLDRMAHVNANFYRDLRLDRAIQNGKSYLHELLQLNSFKKYQNED